MRLMEATTLSEHTARVTKKSIIARKREKVHITSRIAFSFDSTLAARPSCAQRFHSILSVLFARYGAAWYVCLCRSRYSDAAFRNSNIGVAKRWPGAACVIRRAPSQRPGGAAAGRAAAASDGSGTRRRQN